MMMMKIMPSGHVLAAIRHLSDGMGSRPGSGTDNASDVSSPVLVSNLYTVIGNPD